MSQCPCHLAAFALLCTCPLSALGYRLPHSHLQVRRCSELALNSSLKRWSKIAIHYVQTNTEVYGSPEVLSRVCTLKDLRSFQENVATKRFWAWERTFGPRPMDNAKSVVHLPRSSIVCNESDGHWVHIGSKTDSKNGSLWTFYDTYDKFIQILCKYM